MIIIFIPFFFFLSVCVSFCFHISFSGIFFGIIPIPLLSHLSVSFYIQFLFCVARCVVPIWYLKELNIYQVQEL